MKKIICKNVCKSYKKKLVLDNINLEIESDKIYGLIGRNGAGKTTLLSLIAAHNPVTSGDITLDDEIIWENQEALEYICFARQVAPNNPKSAKNYLKIASMHYPNWDKEYADELVKIFELDVKTPLFKLSKGMQSMVTIIVALASKSQFTFIDEPVAGLDVIARDLFYKLLIEEYTESHRTFIISTHIIDEASDVFEEVIMINDHKIILKENTEELLSRAYYISGKEEKVDEITKGLACYHTETIGRSKSTTVLLKDGQMIEEDSDVTVKSVSLQNLFVALCGKDV